MGEGGVDEEEDEEEEDKSLPELDKFIPDEEVKEDDDVDDDSDDPLLSTKSGQLVCMMSVF